MTKLLKNKYSNVLELVEETGKIPVRCIDDGDLEALTYEIEELGYKCRLDPSTDFLLVEKTRAELIKNLKEEIGSLTLDSKKLQDIMPEVYGYLEEKFKGEDLEDFRSGKYLVDIYFLPDRVTYTVGIDAQQLNNEPDWAEDLWDDIELEELQALLEVAK